METSRQVRNLTLILAGVLGACAESHPLADAGDADGGAHSCLPSAVDLVVIVQSNTRVSGLGLALDDHLDALVTPLTMRGIDLHAGLLLTDMGAGTADMRCTAEGFEGLFRTTGRIETTLAACGPYSPYHSITIDNADAALTALQCVDWVADDRCVNAPLEALLRAVAPRDARFTFWDGASGHADAAHAGFRREGALLAAVYVGGFDDCSLVDRSHLAVGAPACADGFTCCSERLFPIERYAEALAEIAPGRAVFHAIAGVPSDLEFDGTSESYELLQRDPRMRAVHELLCDPTVVDVQPSNRIVELARATHGTVRSLCRASVGSALRQALRDTGSVIADAAQCPGR